MRRVLLLIVIPAQAGRAHSAQKTRKPAPGRGSGSEARRRRAQSRQHTRSSDIATTTQQGAGSRPMPGRRSTGVARLV